MRIVLADDHRIVRSGLRWVLESEDDFEVVGEAEDGASLLTVLDEVEADVVLLDIRMPGVGGLDVLARLRAEHPDTRVVILSMHDEPLFIRTAIERGASAYLLKSAGTAELTRALRLVAEGKSYVQSSLAGQVLAEVVEPTAEPPSRRGLEVLRMVADGRSTAEIAEEIELSEATVKSILQQVFERLDVSSRAEAVAAAIRRGLID